MEVVGLKRHFASGNRELTDDEYQSVTAFRKLLVERNKLLGVEGRRKLRERAAADYDLGVTDYDCPAWCALLGGDLMRFYNILIADVGLVPFARFLEAGVLDDEMVIDAILDHQSIEATLLAYKQRNNIASEDDYMYADIA